MPKVTVILTTHNRETLLPRTIKSLLNQNYDDFEVIIVDDASEDNTLQVAKKMTEGDKRFRIIASEVNGGVSVSRNKGLEEAKGEYIRFLDDDDIYPKDSIKKMVEKAESTGGDLIIGGMYFESPFGLMQVLQAVRLSNKDKIAREDSDIIHTFSVGNKQFKRTIIEENKIRFENIRLAEDAFFLLEYLRHCDSIYGCKGNVYNYYKAITIDEKSITQQRNTESLQSLISNMEEIYKRLPYPTEDVVSEYRYRFFSTSLVQSYYQNIWILDKAGEEKLLNKLKELWASLPENQKERVRKKYPDMGFGEGIFSKEEMLGKTKAIIALSPDLKEEEKLKVIDSAYRQKMPFFQIVLSKDDMKYLPEVVQESGNVVFVDSNNKADVFNHAIEVAGSKNALVEFVNEPIYLSGKTLEEALLRLEGRGKDLVIGEVYSIENGSINSLEKTPLSTMFFSGKKLLDKGSRFDETGLKGKYGVYYYPGIRMFTDSMEQLKGGEDVFSEIVDRGKDGLFATLSKNPTALHIADNILQKRKSIVKDRVLLVSGKSERPSMEMRRIYLKMPNGKKTTFYMQSPMSKENKTEIKTLLYHLATSEFIIIDGDNAITRLHTPREGQKICRLDKGENHFEIFGWKEKNINVAF